MRLFTLAFSIALLAAVVRPAGAQQFVYEPKNPAFGGSYLNYSWLMQSAEAQKDFEETTIDRFSRDPFQDFQQSLQRQILSQLSRELIFNRFRDLDLTQEGRFDLGDYVVEIVPGLDGLSIKVFNMLTGDESVITIPSF
ncbi:MAG: curli production assembly/transport component CsgF [Bacteroidota bacterium]